MTDIPAEKFDFELLATTIQGVHQELTRQASKAVNVSLTLRNWLIGYYIAEYELRGSDRAEYGEKVLQRLAKRLADLKVSACETRRLYQYLGFYQAYPSIARSAAAQFQTLVRQRLTSDEPIVRTVSAQLRTSIGNTENPPRNQPYGVNRGSRRERTGANAHRLIEAEITQGMKQLAGMLK